VLDKGAMMSGRLTGWRVLRCVLAVALGAVFLPVEGAAARPQSAYFRIAVSPECTIYGLMREGMLYLADDPDELAEADPVKAEEDLTVDLDNGMRLVNQRFPVAVLAVPAEALPSETTEAVVALQHRFVVVADPATTRRAYSVVYGLAGWGRKDGDGREWLYYGSASVESGARPQTAPLLTLPPVGPLALKVSRTGFERRTISVGVRLMAGETELQQVTRDGENAPIRLRVLDGSGEEVSAEEGDLEKFGRTWGAAPYSVRVTERGTYKVVVEMNAGPLAPELRAEVEFTFH
jgi:hypothetical protein